LVLSDATVASLIGNRLFPVFLPENAVHPAATYQVISGVSDITFGSQDLQMKRVQFDFWAGGENSSGDSTSYRDAKQLEAAVKNILHCFTGILTDKDATRVLSCVRSMTIDNFDTNSRFYRVMNEYEIAFVN